MAEEGKDADLDEKATIFGFIPLALFALIVGVLLILWGIFAIMVGFTSLWLNELPVALAWTAAIIQVPTGVMALIATCRRSVFLMAMTWLLFLLVLCSLVANYIISVAWIVMLIKEQVIAVVHGDPIPHVLSIQLLTLGLVAYVIFFSLGWSAIYCFGSLEEVFKVDGHGWECKNYIQIKAEKPVEGIEVKLASMEVGEAYPDIHHEIRGGARYSRGTSPGYAEIGQGLGQICGNAAVLAMC